MVKSIKGTAVQDTILGTQDVDFIEAGDGSDLIYGFLRADTIDGGNGYDTLFITGTSVDLNVATNAQLLSVEEVSAKLALGGVTINLASQIEGFTLIGSAFSDILTGGSGTNNIDASDGDDTIKGFGGSDTVNGGAGADTLVLTADILGANDIQISGIENVIASGATKGLTINLGRQSERFYLIGSAFGDDITGGSGADVINTGDGDDKIQGYLGNDYINGGNGSDTLYLLLTSLNLNGALDVQLTNVETISAAKAVLGVVIDLSSQTEGFTILGSDQSDYIKGGAGADIFIGSSGMDTVDGGFGEDRLVLTSDLNNITNAQLVSIETISAADAVRGLTINLVAQNERINVIGSAFSDTVTGGVGLDIISSGGGDDVIKGFSSADTIDGGAGFDTLVLTVTSTNLNSATDSQLTNVEAISAIGSTLGVNISLTAQTEGFKLTGSAYSDTLRGGAGDDQFYGFNGSDIVDGGKGADTLLLQATSANLNGSSDAQLLNLETISAFNATSGVTIALYNQSEGFNIEGSNFADQLSGSSQSDTFIGFKGADTIDGGGGVDIVKIDGTSLNLNNASNAQLVNVEKISAANASTGVIIDLSKQTERIDIVGSGYGDTLIGGPGANYLTGGAGADHFVFKGPLGVTNIDTLVDFTPNIDVLDFSQTSFVSLGVVGPLGASAFWSSSSDASAHDGDDRLVYNTATGALYYDADGIGGAAAVQIARFSSLPGLSATDFFIV